ncbi:MAG: hypothetical protein ACLQVJ_30035 [Syntrophobacteraceae bacterium]
MGSVILFLFLIWPNGSVTPATQHLKSMDACYTTLSTMQSADKQWPKGRIPEIVGFCIDDSSGCIDKDGVISCGR